MKVHIYRTRMAMRGNHYAYDACVPVEEVDRSQHSYFQVHDGRTFVSFVDATRPSELNAMELGWPRYEASQAHERTAKVALLGIAKRLYPELEPANVWPELWCEIPALNASHDVRIAEVSQ